MKAAVTIAGRYRLADDVIFVPVDDGSARLLNMGGFFYALPDIGAEMLRGVLDNGITETVRDIARRYDVESERVQSDLLDLLEKLRRSGLLRSGSAPSGVSRIWSGAGQRAVGFVLRLLPEQPSPAVLMTFARMCFAVLGWAATVSAWSRALDQKVARRGKRDTAEPLDRIDTAIRDAAARLPSVACKERALCAWFLLCRQGIQATLVVGIELFPLAGHCWCEVGPRKLTDFEDRCETYMPVARYVGGSGRLEGIVPMHTTPHTDP